MSPTWFAVNNTATHADLSDLEVFGIRVTHRSQDPVTVHRDPQTGRMLATVGTVRVSRDGTVKIIPRLDCPESGVTVLARTALECVERELHRRDRWTYSRATAKRAGHWSARILVQLPEAGSVFTEHTEALRPAALTDDFTPVEGLHTLA